jgi:hypothetical protein
MPDAHPSCGTQQRDSSHSLTRSADGKILKQVFVNNTPLDNSSSGTQARTLHPPPLLRDSLACIVCFCFRVFDAVSQKHCGPSVSSHEHFVAAADARLFFKVAGAHVTRNRSTEASPHPGHGNKRSPEGPEQKTNFDLRPFHSEIQPYLATPTSLRTMHQKTFATFRAGSARCFQIQRFYDGFCSIGVASPILSHGTAYSGHHFTHRCRGDDFVPAQPSTSSTLDLLEQQRSPCFSLLARVVFNDRRPADIRF